MINCPPKDQLQRLSGNSLTGPTYRRLEDHVEKCPACQEYLEKLCDGLNPAGPVAVPELEAAPVLAGFELLERLGRGGMGVVYKARQTCPSRPVAVKLLLAGDFADASQHDRLRREAEAVARLQHPNIVQIHEVREVGGKPFLVLEFAEGGSLAQRLDGRPVPAATAALWTVTLARVLHYIHSQNIIHRDLKPANILLFGPPGVPPEQCLLKVTDFGLAKQEDTLGSIESGAILGTPSYMAPEQAIGLTADARTDVYALGAICYHLLTGRPPFQAATPVETLEQVRDEEPVPPRRLQPKVARDLETICLKCLQKDPTKRYPSAAALADDLERWLRGEVVHARRVGLIGRGWRWGRRKPVVAGLVAGLLLAVSCGLFASLWLWRKAVDNEARALAGEEQARSSLHEEEAARRDTEDQYAMLRTTLNNSIFSSSSPMFTPSEVSPMRQEMLHEAESTLSRLLRRRQEDSQVRVMLATVLTQLGTIYFSKHQNAESVAAFEQAIDLWEQLPTAEMRMSQNRAWHAIAYTCLEQAYEREGRSDGAQHCFEAALHIWQKLVTNDPNRLYQGQLFPAVVDMSCLLVNSAYSEAKVTRRFQEIRARMDRMGGGEECDFFFGLLRVAYLCPQAELHHQVKQKAGILAVAREAAAILADLLPRRSLPKTYRISSVYHSFRVSLWLRRADALQEAGSLSELANRNLRELLQDTPNDHLLLVALSESWQEISKIRWDLDQVEESLAACRSSIETQRQVSILSSTKEDNRPDLGHRFMRLGRKLCELGRLDEAEACFCERQALWPGDSGKHEEALRELRKWAAQVGEDKNSLSPERRLKRERYFDLCARLERKGIAGVSAAGSAKP